MNQSWLDQLTSKDLSSVTASSEQAHLPTDSVQFMARNDLAVVRFSGADVGVFLQSQTCNDHAGVTGKTAQLDGYCSPKGRLLALPMVAADANGEEFYWLLAKDLVETVVKRLTMIAQLPPADPDKPWIRAVKPADVTISVEDEWAVVGLGKHSDLVSPSLDLWFGKSDAEELSSGWSEGVCVIKARSAVGIARSLLFGPTEAVQTSLAACLDALPDNTNEPLWSTESSWVLGDIQAGVPSIVSSTQDAFVPQMVNLGQVDGLSFTKGCYPGQEIVARMQYLGKLKRAMVRFSSASTSVPQPGADVSTFTYQGATLCAQELPYSD